MFTYILDKIIRGLKVEAREMAENDKSYFSSGCWA